MYMKECPNCKELIGDNARSCFNCGYDFIYKRVRTQQEKRELEQIEKQKRAEKQAEKEKHQIQIQKNANYEYDVDCIRDEDNGSVNILKIKDLIHQYAEKGWRLHSVFRNELGKNSSSGGANGIYVGSNATIEETIFIFERKIKKEED